MFGRVLFVTTLCVAAALLGSFSLMERLPALAPVVAAPGSDALAGVAANSPLPKLPERQSSGYREALLRADERGQYTADVLIDGLPVRMLVDTGASDVFVSALTAARLGLVASGDRPRAIRTANGMSTATPVLLSRLSFAGLYMNDVGALILTPEAGEVNLLGESFLKRLVSVEQRDGVLILRQ
jgi:aspartyl protease family protein